ncbi:unnamed protein product [Linum tenue]|uniref:Uncharacterized protein n=1 Tax=Linum tenue TaxID=586396 RepID=A0AAV0P4Q8_9ROSI|nr:unnamed protein product [Linum tenue]
MEGLENMAFVANAVSLFTYFYGYMNFSITKSATTLTNFMGTAFLLSLFGGFLSDTYLSRFTTCVLFGTFEILGYVLLTVQARVHQLRPTPCNGAAALSGGSQSTLYIGLYLIALGTSGVKAALPSLGADQFDSRNPKEAGKLSSFFNWFLFSLTVGAIVGVTIVVWVSANVGWDWGFGLCGLAVLCAVVFVSMGKSLYRMNAPSGSPFVRFAQVFVAAIRNWNVPTPKAEDELYEIKEKGKGGINGEILQRTHQFRYVSNQNVELSPTNLNPWRLCTTTQVEETKILIRMLPIILSTVFMNTCLAQLQTFTIQQSTTMDRNFLGFQIPGPSIPVIPLLFMFLLIPLYDRVFVPLARRFTGIPTGIRHLQRIGIGLVLSAVSMAVAGIVETKRKRVAVEHGMYSVFWLGFQYSIFGAADMFTLVGLLEFFYSESSAGMKALSTAISWTSLAFGYFLSTVVVEVVNKVSGGWLESNNLNRDKLNYFYWLLSALSVVNLGAYLLCASWYRYKEVEVVVAAREGDGREKRVGEFVGV